MGGLYDATNVVKKSTSVITTIDYDHTERLGKTINEIAIQKAGIIKQDCPVVISPQNAGYSAIHKIIEEKNAKIIELSDIKISFEDKNYAIINNEKYEFNLLGEHQAQNLALALGAIKSLNIKINKETIKKALKTVTWHFRLEYLKEKNILIDSAHNPNGAKVLKEFLNKNFKIKKTFIFGCLKNKEYEKMLDTLIEKDDVFYFYEFDYPNALKFNELPKKYQAQKISNIQEIEEIIKKDKNLKIFCGSIYMLGKLFKEIKLN